MWLIFIVVVVVISLLMVFLLLAIRTLTAQAKVQLNRYFLKNLETYDRLAENKNEQIRAMETTLADLESRAESARARLEAMTQTDAVRHPAPAPVQSAGTEASSASYRDMDFLKDYAYVRQHMKLDYKKLVQDVLKELDHGEDKELTLCQDMLRKIPKEKLYDIIVMQETEQVEYLKELFDDEEDAYLDRYAEESGSFDLLSFYNHLTDYVRSHENEVYIRTGNPEEIQELESGNVHVLLDEEVHEGVRISYKNTVYDFSL